MKKICFVCPTVLLKRPIAEIINRLEGYKCGLFLPKEPFKDINNSFHYSKIRNAKIYNYSVINPPFFSSEFPIPINPNFLIKMVKIFSKYDIIHMWVPFYICNTILAFIKKIFYPNKKLILTMDTIPGYSFKMGKIMDLIFKIYYKTIGKIVFSASNIITLYSESMKKYALKAGIPVNKIIITPTGVNVDIKKQNRDIRKELNIKKDDKIILFVGLLNTRKGVDLILKTAQKLDSKNIKIIIVGDGPQKKKNHKYVKQNNLENIFIFTGYRKDVHNFYHEADIFFFPSRGEGLAGVLMESMIYGVPIITSNIPGSRDLIKDNYNGFLCEIEDVNSYTNKIRVLLENKKLREKFIINSKEQINNNYTWDKNFIEFKRLY